MLTKSQLYSLISSALFSCCCCSEAAADDNKKSLVPQITLQIDPAPRDDYSYRRVNQKQTVNLMLYGFRDQPDTPSIQKSRKDLGGFFKQHLDRIKDDYFNKDPQSTRFVTGDRDFDSTQINRGISTEPAKMVGFTTPMGKMTFGGGYTWGEKNPALMRRTKAEGFFGGVSYDTGPVGYQLSYLKSGDKVAGFRVGGSSIQYNSLMLASSFKVTERLGLTATAQYRTDKDPLTTGDKQMIFTIGTKWKF